MTQDTTQDVTQTAFRLFILAVVATPFLVFGQSGQTTITTTSDVRDTVTVVGVTSKGGGTFVIDHPLDPANKLLYHSFVESPDMKNVYDGIVVLNSSGEAAVVLPSYFLALNADVRYLATPLGESMPDLYMKQDVAKRWFGFVGRPVFKIAGGAAGGRVSWQVTGIRHDLAAEVHPIIPEVQKGPDALADVGEYVFPEFYER